MRNWQKGLSLVELMIVIGALGGVALIVAQISKQQITNQVRSETKFENLELKRLISTTLYDRQACQKSFAGVNIGSTLNEIRNAAGSSLYKVGDVLSGAIKITEFKTFHKLDNGDGTHQMDLKVTLENQKKIATLNLPVLTIPLKVSATSPTGAITDCTTEGSHYVRKSGDTMSGDLIVETKLGIGIDDPAARLDVAGGVKMANDTSACALKTEGTQRYNSTSKMMEFCNGTSWMPIGVNKELKCIRIMTKAVSGTLAAQCPAGYIVTGCLSGCTGNTSDQDESVNLSTNTCYLNDVSCGGERVLYGICCKME